MGAEFHTKKQDSICQKNVKNMANKLEHETTILTPGNLHATLLK
jgi:hypothetical protein